jgi:microsomal prostaglandin-E synthase 2
MSMAHGKIKKKYGIDDERQALFSTLDEWVSNIQSRPAQCTPDLGDVAVYGVINASTGTALFDDILSHRDDALRPWYEAVQKAVEG